MDANIFIIYVCTYISLGPINHVIFLLELHVSLWLAFVVYIITPTFIKMNTPKFYDYAWTQICPTYSYWCLSWMLKTLSISLGTVHICTSLGPISHVPIPF